MVQPAFSNDTGCALLIRLAESIAGSGAESQVSSKVFECWYPTSGTEVTQRVSIRYLDLLNL